ncbi:MAG: HAMP domain-containing sensor histidine kinase [Actinomycetota bacterium]
MRSQLRSVRVRFAVVAFAAIYLPVLVLLSVSVVSEQTTVEDTGERVITETEVRSGPPTAVYVAAVLLAPAAAALAWWLAGRAVAPVRRAIEIQHDLIEEVSHELRTPLAVIINGAEVLLGRPEPGVDDLRTGLARAQTAAERMRGTVDALLVDARGRARSIERQPLDVADLARAVAAELQPLADGRSVTLTATVDGDTRAAVDEAMVSRAVLNVATNAVEHSEPGQTVTIVARPDPADGALVLVAVSDQGPGIEPADTERVFERFWTRRDGGTGLGLSVARQIAEAHGGSVTVAETASGARIEIRLRR